MASSSRRRTRGGGPSAFDERTAFDESFRILRSNLDVALADIEKPTVVVTSANPNEGKTLMCANLAMAFAAAGRRTVLVDLDLRHPNAHRLVGAHNEFGASEVLLGSRTLKEAMQYVELPVPGNRSRPGLFFLATGNQVQNPAELLGSGRTARLLDGLAAQADLVLLDTPPVLPVADTLVIGRMAAGAVLVTEARATAVAAIQKAKDLLIRNQTRLLGVVLNKFQLGDTMGGYGYGYGYGYGTALPPPDDEEGLLEAGLEELDGPGGEEDGQVEAVANGTASRRFRPRPRPSV